MISKQLFQTHLICRTARGDKTGTALSFVLPEENELFESVQLQLSGGKTDGEVALKPYHFKMDQVEKFKYRVTVSFMFHVIYVTQTLYSCSRTHPCLDIENMQTKKQFLKYKFLKLKTDIILIKIIILESKNRSLFALQL